MFYDFISDIRDGFCAMSRRDKVAVAIFCAVALAYVITLSYCQHQSYLRYERQQAAWEESVVYIDGHPVNREDYERANEAWRAEHPHEYGIFD